MTIYGEGCNRTAEGLRLRNEEEQEGLRVKD